MSTERELERADADKEALERLKVCAESLACNAANLRADTLPGEANADFYIRTADEHEQWSKDLLALIAKQEGLEREVERLRAVGCVPTNGALKELRDELSAEFEALPDGEYVTFSLGFLRRLAQHKCGSEGGLAYQTARAEAAESKLSALETKVAAARVALEDQDEGRQFVRVDNALRALLDPAVPVETAQRTETITRVHLPSDVASIPDAYVDVRSPVPPSQGAETRPCTCPPDEAPALCQQKFALSDCLAAAQPHPDVTGLVEALKRACDALQDLLQLAAATPALRGHEHVSLGIQVNNAITTGRQALTAFQSRQDERP